MNLQSIRDQLDLERRTLSVDGHAIEILPLLTRIRSADGLVNNILFSSLTAENADAAIAEQAAHYRSLGVEVEWKAYLHDKPADLRQRLAAHGFETGPLEAVLVLDLNDHPKWIDESALGSFEWKPRTGRTLPPSGHRDLPKELWIHRPGTTGRDSKRLPRATRIHRTRRRSAGKHRPSLHTSQKRIRRPVRRGNARKPSRPRALSRGRRRPRPRCRRNGRALSDRGRAADQSPDPRKTRIHPIDRHVAVRSAGAMISRSRAPFFQLPAISEQVIRWT